MQGAVWHYNDASKTLKNGKDVELKGLVAFDIMEDKKDDPELQIKINEGNEALGLELKDGKAVLGSLVIFENSIDGNHQKWKRSEIETIGTMKRFMLKNVMSNLHLHADWHGYFTNGYLEKTLTIEDCKLVFQIYYKYPRTTDTQ